MIPREPAGPAPRTFAVVGGAGAMGRITVRDLLRTPRGLEVMVADVADRTALQWAATDVSAVFHLAAQVAVTTSLKEPLADFEVNLRGTLNVLETLRAQENPPPATRTARMAGVPSTKEEYTT